MGFAAGEIENAEILSIDTQSVERVKSFKKIRLKLELSFVRRRKKNKKFDDIRHVKIFLIDRIRT